jgi:hypothetical protein
MAKNIKDIGKTIKKTDREFILGQMGVNIKGFIETIKNMEWAHINGLMVGNT